MPIFDSPDMRVFDPNPEGQLPLFEDEQPQTFEPEVEDQMDLEEMTKVIEELFNQFDSSQLRSDVLDEIESSRESYAQKTVGTDFPWPNASNMVTPLTRIAVDEMEPRLVASVAGREPFLRVENFPGASTMEEAMAVETYINYVLDKEVKIYPLVSKMTHKMLLDGTIFTLGYWNREEKNIMQMTQGGQKMEMNEVVFDGPQVSIISAEHVWMPDDVDDEDWEHVPVIRYVQEYYLKDLIGRAQTEEGWVLENLDSVGTTSRVLTKAQELEDVSEDDDIEEIEKITCYEAYLPNYGGMGEDLIVLVDKDSFKVLRLRRQVEVFGANRKPIRRHTIYREEGTSWGWPVYTTIKGIQEGMDAMWNRCVNSADITMTPWGFYKQGVAGTTMSRLRIMPGSLFPADDPSAYVFPNLGMFKPTEFVPLIQIYQAMFEKSTNVSDFTQGMESQIAGKRGSTATGTLAILQEGKVKHEYRGTLFQHQFLELLIQIYDLVADNMPQEDIYPVTGSQVLNITLSKDYRFSLGPSTVTANRFVDRKEVEDMMMVMQPFMSLINPMTPIKKLLHTYGERAEDWIDPELNKIVQQYMMRKQNIQALTQMGIPEQVAAQLTDQGITPDNVEEYVKQIGEEGGEAAGTASVGGLPPGQQGQIA